MKASVIGAGAWGITLAQVLCDNNHDVLVYDVNKSFIDDINKGHHPFFPNVEIKGMKGVYTLEEAISHGDYIILCVPNKFLRGLLKDINRIIKEPKIFVNVSKGIEPITMKCVCEIIYEEMDEKNILGYATLSGPSHAEEVIARKLTLLVSSSNNEEIAQKVQLLFANNEYLRVYTSNDVKGCEIGGAIKNAIAIVSGILTGVGLGENARAALISRGILEIIKVVEAMGGNRETAYGLTGMGDLIVTASSENSRNFRAGREIGMGMSAEDAVKNSIQTVEGVRAVLAAQQIAQKYNMDLPIIASAYSVLYENVSPKEAITNVLSRALKAE